jgi:hypothetical protein
MKSGMSSKEPKKSVQDPSSRRACHSDRLRSHVRNVGHRRDNEAFQKRMQESGVKDHVPTKIVTLKVRLGDGEHVNPGMHLGEKSGQGCKDN